MKGFIADGIEYRGVPIVIDEDPSTEENVVYSVSNNFYIKYPKRKDGKLDMRYGICKLHRLLKIK